MGWRAWEHPCYSRKVPRIRRLTSAPLWPQHRSWQENTGICQSGEREMEKLDRLRGYGLLGSFCSYCAQQLLRTKPGRRRVKRNAPIEWSPRAPSAL